METIEQSILSDYPEPDNQPEDWTEYEDEMIEKYYLPEYLEKETIREKYSFDRSYRSCLDSRIKQEKQFFHYCDNG